MRKQILFSLTLVAFLACSKQQNENPSGDTTKLAATAIKEGQGKGIVRAVNASSKSITLDAGTVAGVMDAMTMDYQVQKPELLAGLNVGDSVTFTLQDRGEGNYLVTAIKPIKK
ncbi:MAG TPA: copper-binding protein [Candidatus Kapabacteria bacterium]|jgi:Cu/Ag efflux protein CusF